MAVGVGAVLPGGCDDLKLSDRGFVETNDHYETNLPGVRAAGDLIGPPWLAHVASFEAIHAVEIDVSIRITRAKRSTFFRAAPTAIPRSPASA